MIIKKSDYAGFCFGVKRAADLIENTISVTKKEIMTFATTFTK